MLFLWIVILLLGVSLMWGAPVLSDAGNWRRYVPYVAVFVVGSVANWFGLFRPVLVGVSPTGTNWAVPAYLLLGVAATVVYAWRLHGLVRAGVHSLSWPFGTTVWAILAGLYITWACAVHYDFVAAGKGKVGVMFTRSMPTVQAATGCYTLLLIRVGRHAVDYRCAKGAVIGGALMQWPFLPWPDYRSGRSVALKDIIGRLEKDAIQAIPKEHSATATH